MRFLHIAISEKFLPPLISLIESNLEPSQHLFAFITSEKYEFGLKPKNNIRFYHTDSDFNTLLELMKKAEKIILHGLWRRKINIILTNNPELLKKCYWIMWGADFYFPETHDSIHKRVIRDIPYVISGVEGDVQLIRQEYGSSAEHIEGLVYAQSSHHPYQPFIQPAPLINILLGNSAAETNRHLSAIEDLWPHRNKIRKIYTPLSYAGNEQYIEQVMQKGESKFGKKFIPIINYLSTEDYFNLLDNIHIAYFNHNRQQGLGNILHLLESGKKIFIDADTTTYKSFEKKGFCIFSTKEFSILPMKQSEADMNRTLHAKYYSERATISLLSKIFGT